MTTNNTTHPDDLTFVDHLNRIPVLTAVVVVGIAVSLFNVVTVAILLRSNKLRRPHNYPIINILLAATLQSLFAVPAYAFNRLDGDIPHHRESWICNIYRFPYFLCGDMLRYPLTAPCTYSLFSVCFFFFFLLFSSFEIKMN